MVTIWDPKPRQIKIAGWVLWPGYATRPAPTELVPSPSDRHIATWKSPVPTWEARHSRVESPPRCFSGFFACSSHFTQSIAAVDFHRRSSSLLLSLHRTETYSENMRLGGLLFLIAAHNPTSGATCDCDLVAVFWPLLGDIIFVSFRSRYWIWERNLADALRRRVQWTV